MPTPNQNERPDSENKIVPEPGEAFIPETEPPVKQERQTDMEKGNDARNTNTRTHNNDQPAGE